MQMHLPNRYYQFLFQINLQQLNIKSDLLPEKGMLYFFSNFEEDDNFKVIYIEDISNINLYNLPVDYGQDYQKESNTEGVLKLKFAHGIHFDTSDLVSKINSENEELYNNSKLMLQEMYKDYFFTDFKVFVSESKVKNDMSPLLMIPSMDILLDNYLLDWDAHGGSIGFMINTEELKLMKFDNIDIEGIQDEYIYQLLYEIK